MSDLPQDATPLDQAAIVWHELFMSYVRAGFERQEALTLLLAQMTHLNGPK